MPKPKAQTTVVAGIAPGPLPQAKLEENLIPGADPLDAQTGVWPPKTVPDALVAALFGQADPTPAEIAQYGDKDAVPPMKTFVIVDAAKLAQGRSVIETCGMPWRCLMKGDVEDELGDVLPYLVELEQDARFTRTLLTYVPKVNEDMATFHLCHKEPGVFIRSRKDLSDVWQHVRKFTRATGPTGKEYYFRFWEARNMSGILESMPEAQLASFFQHVLTFVAFFKGPLGWEANAYSMAKD